MFILRTLVETYCSQKEGRLYACFIDFRKAFDMVIQKVLKLNYKKLVLEQNFTILLKVCTDAENHAFE